MVVVGAYIELHELEMYHARVSIAARPETSPANVGIGGEVRGFAEFTTITMVIPPEFTQFRRIFFWLSCRLVLENCGGSSLLLSTALHAYRAISNDSGIRCH